MFNAQKPTNQNRKTLIIKPKVMIFFPLPKVVTRYSPQGEMPGI